MQLFGGIYKDKTILVTGHTGFKGSWLAFWLQKLGANVVGYALEPESAFAHINLLSLPVVSYHGNILDRDKLQQVFISHQPDLLFHLAADPLVRESYRNPVKTYETNVIGTLNVYEAARSCKNLSGIVSITTDKVYENQEWTWGYRENDTLGGYDPYSASKACVEIMSASYRNSFLQDKNMLLCTARSGNVVGGGDWGHERLIPDMMRAVLKQEKVMIRNPKSVRPWQHVLDPLAGYLQLGQQLLEKKSEYATAWNFAPAISQNIEVNEVLNLAKSKWGKIEFEYEISRENFHETRILKLDNTKAISELQWKPVWNIYQTIENTVEWYRQWIEKKEVITEMQLQCYINDACNANAGWSVQA